MPIRVLIADDYLVIRSGLRALLAADDHIEVAGEAADGREVLELAASSRPDVVLLDVGMPGESGIEVARRLKELHPQIAVLFLTLHEDEVLLHEALRAGAAGTVMKRADRTEILAAIRAARRDELRVPPTMTPELPRPQDGSAVPDRSLPEPLTEREVEILRLLAHGHTSRQIADAIGNSIRTVKALRANLLGKLGATNRVGLVDYAEKHALL